MLSADRDCGLDALRAFAALLVLFAHGGYFLFAAFPHFDVYAVTGWIGTDLFFALSGFLVTRQLLRMPARDHRAALRFVAWRAWRLLPLYWLFLGVNLMLAQWAGSALPADLPSYAALAQNLAWPHPAFFAEAWNLPLLLLFSLAAPGLVLGAGGTRDRTRTVALVFSLLLLLGVALRAVWVMEGDMSWDEGVRKIVVARLDACVYGALAGIWWTSRMVSSRSSAALPLLVAIALVLACTGYFAMPRDVSNWAQIGLFVASGVAGATACLVAARQSHGGYASARVVDALARWSYPLYLVNMPVLWAMTLVGQGQSPVALTGVLRFLVWLMLSLLFAALVHRSLERPLLAWRARVLSVSPATSATSR